MLVHGDVRQAGYAVDDEENEDGIRCIGAAIFDQDGRVTGAISVSAPTPYLPAENAEDLSVPLVRAAKGVSEALGAPARLEEAARTT